MSNIFNWLSSESGVAWVVAIFSLAGWLIYWRRHEKPISIVIQETENIELLNIHSSQKSNLLIQYNDGESTYPIRNLVQKKVILYNIGSTDIIEPIEFPLTFIPNNKVQFRSTDFVKVISERAECKSSIRCNSKGEKDEILITLDFLNSTKKHQHFVILYILTENFIELLSRPVVGKGWSVQAFKKDRLSKIGTIANALYYALVFGTLVLLFNPVSFLMAQSINLIAKWFNLSPTDSLMNFVAFMMFIGVIWITFKAIDRYERVGRKIIAGQIVAPLLDYPPPDLIGNL